MIGVPLLILAVSMCFARLMVFIMIVASGACFAGGIKREGDIWLACFIDGWGGS